MTTEGKLLTVRREEIVKEIYDIQVREKVYTLVKTWIDDVPVSEIVLNSQGYNITTPSTLEYLNEVIEESK
jgi:hypothetical protein